jgi:hypothetical protein
MTLDGSGNLLVGKTSLGIANAGNTLAAGGYTEFTRTATSTSTGGTLNVGRNSYDGQLATFWKDGSTVGSIGVHTNKVLLTSPTGSNTLALGSTLADGNSAGLYMYHAANSIIPFKSSDNSLPNGVQSLGHSSYRWKDLYLSGGVFLGGTGSANKLEDYEEGSYNATFTTQNGSINLNGTQNRMNYTKIGRQVTITGRVVVASVSNPSGYVRFSLPFTNVSESEDEGHTALNVITYNVSGIGSNVLFAEVGPNTAYGILLKSADNSSWSYLNASGFSANDIIYMNGTYLTDA